VNTSGTGMKGVVSGLKHDSTVQYGTVIQYHTVVGKWSTEIMGGALSRLEGI
jgi:hypothetical protein